MRQKIDPRIGKVLLKPKQLQKGIKKAANWLNKEYKGKQPIIIGVLKGCIPFIGSILPMLHFDFQIDFMSASSFRGNLERQNKLDISLDITTDIKGKDVIILEDIIDTAQTLFMIIEMLKTRKPKSIKIVTLLDKVETRKVDLYSDYSCFKIPNEFIVGFGLDYKEIMRNFNYIGCLKPEFLEQEKNKKG